MYLRLKPAGYQPHSSFDTTGDFLHDTDASVIRDLESDHIASFDWKYGGPRGRFKFIDVHQIELASARAESGDDRSRAMLDRTCRGIARLVGAGSGGAAQYAVGERWEIPTRVRTLAGQAVAIQALASAGRVERRREDFLLGVGLIDFVAIRSDSRSRGGRTKAQPARFSRSRVRDLAWYCLATRAFARAYDDSSLQRHAGQIFDRLLERVTSQPRVSRASRNTDESLTLDDTVAVADAAWEFGLSCNDRRLLGHASGLLEQALHGHGHPDGGWCQAPDAAVAIDRDTPLDIDCTIDIIRLVQKMLRRGKHPTLNRFAASGCRALFRPEVARARVPESGLLLIDRELLDPNGNSTSRSEFNGRRRGRKRRVEACLANA